MKKTFKKQTRGTYSYKELSVSMLYVDHSYQRPLNESRVAKMVANFCPEMFRHLPVVVVKVGNKYQILDGQHKTELARQVFGPDAVVYCRIEKTSAAALSFIALNSGKEEVKPADKFRALLHAKDQKAVQVVKAIQAIGHDIKLDAGHTKINEFKLAASWPLYKFVEKLGKNRLLSMLVMLDSNFTDPDGEHLENTAKEAIFINALFRLYNSQFTTDEIAFGLRGSICAADIKQKAKAKATDGGHAVTMECFKVMQQIIKKKLKIKK